MNRRTTPFALAAAATATSLVNAGDVTSTRQSLFPTDWSVPERWDHNVPGLMTFPNNGNEGHTYDVVFPNNFVSMDVPITIDSLSGQYEIALSGRTLTVLGEMSASFAELRNGSIATGSMRATTTMILDDVSGTTGLITLDANADLRLRISLGASDLSAGGVRFMGDGDVYSDDGGIPSLDLSGKTITKAGGASVSDITARIIASELTVSNEQPGTLIRFGQVDQSWGQLNITTRDSEVEFSKNLAVGNVNVQVNDMLVQGSVITLRGDVTLAGTWTQSSAVSIFGRGTRLTASFGTGTLSGGVLNCDVYAPFKVVEGASVGVNGLVTNQGRAEFHRATIEGGGYSNEGETIFENAAGDMVIRDTDLTNAPGAKLFVRNPLRLSGSARVKNMGGTIYLGSVFPDEPGDELTSSFENSTPTSLISGLFEGGTVRVPFSSVGAIEATEAPLRFESTITLSGIVNANPAAVVLSPEPGPPGTPIMIGDLVVFGTGAVAEATDALLIERGDAVITGKLRSLGGDPLFQVRLAGDATLSGGTLDVKAPMRFLQDGGLVGTSALTTNVGTYDLRAGGIAIPGVVNNGLLRIIALESFDAVTIARLDNNSEVRHHQGVVQMGSDINNSGSWTARSPTGPGTSSVFVRYPGASGSGVFNNTGTIAADPNATIDFLVPVSSPGTVVADAGTVRFSGTVDQFDQATGQLSGGTWTIRNGGKILFEDQQTGRVRTLGETTAVKVTGSSPAPDEPWTAIGSVAGSLDVTGQSELDLTGNDSSGDLGVDPGGSVHANEVILRLPGDPSGRGVSTRLIARDITNRGVLAASGSASVQAATIELIDDGSLRGVAGTFAATLVTNTSGVVEPGAAVTTERGATASIGRINLDGDYTQESGGQLRIEIGGPAPDGADRVSVTGVATLAGSLEVSLVNGFTPAQGESFTVLDAAMVSGGFESVSAHGFLVTHDPQGVRAIYIGACPADLAQPYGVLDFSDIVKFLTLFAADDPVADVALPIGVLDFSDVVAFLGSFGAGCP